MHFVVGFFVQRLTRVVPEKKAIKRLWCGILYLKVLEFWPHFSWDVCIFHKSM